MSYILYLDKSEDFICEVQIKNASLKNSIVRLIVESIEGPTLVFNGELDNDRCIIPIKKLKGILDENMRGNIFLEIIIEDTYFKPWKSDFIVKEHTSVKVKVNEQKQSSLSNKPIVKIKTPIIKFNERKLLLPIIPKNSKKDIIIPKKEIGMLCEQFGIKKNNFHKKQKDFIQLLREYFRINPEYNKNIKTILIGINNYFL